MAGGSAYTNAQWRYLYNLHRMGYSYRELGDWIGYSYKTIAVTFERLGLHHRPTQPLSDFEQEFRLLGETSPRKLLIQTDAKTGKRVAFYRTMREASDKTGIPYASISCCVTGINETNRGYRWEWVEEVERDCLTPK